MDTRTVLCPGTNLDGTPCTRHPRHGHKTCPQHDPAKIEARAAALEAEARRIRATAVPA